MIKFAAIALFALVAAAAADDWEKETGLLLGHEKVFGPFCMEQRNYIVSDIKQRASEKSSVLFETFFGAATEIADEVLNVEKQAIEELTKQIQANEDVKEGPLPEDEIQKLIEEGKREIQSKGALGRLAAASKSAASVLVNTANSALFVRLAQLRAKMNAGTLFRGIFNTCNQVVEYETHLEAALGEAKESLKAEHGEQEVQKYIDEITVPQLKCSTTKFVSRLQAFCELFRTGTGPFTKMLGLKPTLANAIEEHAGAVEQQQQQQ